MTSSVVVVAAHADDEALGCGGTISRYVSEGKNVVVVFMTDGVSSRVQGESGEKDNRESAAKKAMQVLGVNQFYQFDFPDNKMDTVPLIDVVQKIESVISEVQPQIVLTHYAHDLNIDHRVTHQAVMTCCRPQKSCSVKKILSFEVLSSTEWNSPSLPAFRPQYVVDISQHWEKKIAALTCYDKEMRAQPHSRSYECVEALAILRGNTNGFLKAEAFCVERILVV